MTNLPEKLRTNGVYAAFAEFKTLSEDSAVNASTVVVADHNDHENMMAAREMRLRIVKMRTALEKRKNEYKKPVLNESRLIDATYNAICKSFKQTEAHLFQLETTHERHLAAQRLAALKSVMPEITEAPKDLGKLTNIEFSDRAHLLRYISDLRAVQRPDIKTPFFNELDELLNKYAG